MGYARWENFITVINRAIESCKSTRFDPEDHFRGVTKMVTLGSDAKRKIEDLQGEIDITDEHVQNNKSVREMLVKRNIKPESLRAEEDIKKLERRIKSDEKKLAEASRKLPVQRKATEESNI